VSRRRQRSAGATIRLDGSSIPAPAAFNPHLPAPLDTALASYEQSPAKPLILKRYGAGNRRMTDNITASSVSAGYGRIYHLSV
jgi:hypothetical protein